MRQQHWRFSPPPYKLHRCYLSGCPQRLLVSPCCLLQSTSASPLHPLHTRHCLQCTVVRSSSRPVSPTANPSTAWASTCQHLSATGALPCNRRWTGPDSWTGPTPGFPSDQCSAKVSQQPRWTQIKDHVGLNLSLSVMDWC